MAAMLRITSPTRQILRSSRASTAIACLCATAALLAGSAPAQAQSAPPAAAPAKPHPLLGHWAWHFKGAAGKACTETLDFRADGTRTSQSGDAVNQAGYTVTAVPSLLGFYRLHETVTRSDGKPDCAGDPHPVSEEATERFIQFDPKMDLLLVCKSESLQACYGPLAKLKK